MAYTAAQTTALNEQITKFLKRLESVETDRRFRKQSSREQAIARICQAELAQLRQQLGVTAVIDESGIVQSVDGPVSSLHSYTSDLRNAVRAHFADRLNDRNSYQIEIGATGQRRLESQHLALKFCRKSSAETRARKSAHVATIDRKQTQSRTISRSAVIAKASELLGANSYIGLALGIAALTGRRVTEILKTARFEATGENTVKFWGQLKTKGSTEPRDGYEIPTLAPARQICQALDRLRSMKDFSQTSERDVNRLTSKELGQQVRRHFGAIILDPQAKDLRAAYAQICWDCGYGKQPGMLQLKHFATLLGHSERDNLTAVSYLVFETTP